MVGQWGPPRKVMESEREGPDRTMGRRRRRKPIRSTSVGRVHGWWPIAPPPPTAQSADTMGCVCIPSRTERANQKGKVVNRKRRRRRRRKGAIVFANPNHYGRRASWHGAPKHTKTQPSNSRSNFFSNSQRVTSRQTLDLSP